MSDAFRLGSYASRMLAKVPAMILCAGQVNTGSPQESDEVCILCGLLKSNEFGLGKGQSLCFEQQILDVAIAATAAQQRFDIPVDGFDHT